MQMGLLKKTILAYYRFLVKVLPVNERKVVFMSSLSRDAAGNPGAIYNEMVRQGLDKAYKCYFILQSPKRVNLAGRARKVKSSRALFYFVMATAGIWISDTRFQNYVIKRDKVTYIQTWHGTPLKKIALDMEQVYMAECTDVNAYHEEFRKNASTWDYLIVQNDYSMHIFKEAFDFKGEFIKSGYPRNDLLFEQNDSEHISILRTKYGIPDGKKVMLYAPTWRDDEYYDKEWYKFPTELDFERMKEAFEDEYVLILKCHYMVGDKPCHKADAGKESKERGGYDGFVTWAPCNCEITELYLISDLLITDYSSAMFDYGILLRPMFFYVYDYDDYKDKLRGFYFDLLAEAPGPIVTETTELVQAIKEYHYSEHEGAYEAFSRKYHVYEKGDAAKKVISRFTLH